MPRQSRIVIPKIPYTITRRGNRQEDVFYSGCVSALDDPNLWAAIRYVERNPVRAKNDTLGRVQLRIVD